MNIASGHEGVSSAPVAWSVALIPVQELIAAARRTRDLAVGSALLSWSMSRILEALERGGAEVVVPARAPGEGVGGFARYLGRTSYSIPNRASGWAKGDICPLLRSLEEVLEEGWQELVADVVRRGGPWGLGEEGWRMVTDELSSVPCPVRVVWATSRLEQGWTGHLREVDGVFQAVKRARPVAVHEGAPVGKCGQCGRREAVGGRRWEPWRRFQRRLVALPEVLLGYRLEPADRLCSVCLVKRLAGYLPEAAAMPSTSQIAASGWLERIRSVEDLRAYVDTLMARAGSVEGFREDPFPLLFERTRRRVAREPEVVGRSRGELEELEAAVARFKARLRQLEAEPPAEPSSYLAVIVFDGDDVGKAVHEAPEVAAGRLAAFVGEAGGEPAGAGSSLADLVERHESRAVYLGGDEGLVLCPLERVLDLAAALRQRWVELVGDELPSHPGLSMGISIFDRERPLGAAIAQAHRGVAAAKALSGKNAVTITIETPSGSGWGARARWGEQWDGVRAAVERIRSGHLSAGWAYDVEEFLRSLPAEVLGSEGEHWPAIRTEVERRTRRRIPRRLQELADDVWAEVGRRDVWEPPQAGELGPELPDLLHVVGFLAREPGAPDQEAA